MENFEKQKDKYEARIQRFLGYLRQIDDNWINQRSWVKDLKAFQLGKSNVWKDVLFADETAAKDKARLYFDVVMYASIRNEHKFGKKIEQVEGGFAIEPQTDDEINYDKNEHEMLLGWLWWNALYKEADKAKQFNPTQKDELREKQRKMAKRMSTLMR